MDNKIILAHSGYGHLKRFQLARLIFDLTVRFFDKFINRSSRTKNQMIQAACPGMQNTSEGSYQIDVQAKAFEMHRGFTKKIIKSKKSGSFPKMPCIFF